MHSIIFDPPVIAHRGASAYAPENTFSAFAKAAQLGIHWLEFDVMPAACGEPVIIHDENLKRTTNGVGKVGDFPYSYLQTLDAGKWFNTYFSGERIPSLSGILKFLSDAELNANIEIKTSSQYELELIKRVVELTAPYIKSNKITLLFSSFSWPVLYLLREHMPNCILGLLLHSWRKNWIEVAKELNCQTINVNQRILTQKSVEKVKNTGKMLLAYTVNEPKRAELLYRFGVDALFSDVPDIIAKISTQALD